jgi:hypothetical protein
MHPLAAAARSAVAPAPRTRPCHTGTRARPRLSTPAIFHPMPTAARRPAAAGYRWPASHPVTPTARPGMTHREEQSMRRRIKSTPAESVLDERQLQAPCAARVSAVRYAAEACSEIAGRQPAVIYKAKERFNKHLQIRPWLPLHEALPDLSGCAHAGGWCSRHYPHLIRIRDAWVDSSGLAGASSYTR